MPDVLNKLNIQTEMQDVQYVLQICAQNTKSRMEDRNLRLRDVSCNYCWDVCKGLIYLESLQGSCLSSVGIVARLWDGLPSDRCSIHSWVRLFISSKGSTADLRPTQPHTQLERRALSPRVMLSVCEPW